MPNEIDQNVFSKSVERYFEDTRFLLKIHQDYEKKLENYTAFRFNVFKYIGMWENTMSQIIADILETNGEHGQGKLFLNHLLNLIPSELKDSLLQRDKNPTITTEEYTKQHLNNKRRMDILIDWGSFGIMIENKPKAKDQDSQLKEYAEDLTNKYGKDKFIMIYLSNGNLPDTCSISEEDRKKFEEAGQFVHFTYNGLFKTWIENCIRDCKSEKYKTFLTDFLNKIIYNYL